MEIYKNFPDNLIRDKVLSSWKEYKKSKGLIGNLVFEARMEGIPDVDIEKLFFTQDQPEQSIKPAKNVKKGRRTT